MVSRSTSSARRVGLLRIAGLWLLLVASGSLAQTGLIPQWYFSTRTVEIGGPDEVSGVATDASGNTYVTGHFVGTADFDPGPGEVELVSNGTEDAYLAKYDLAGALVFVRQFGGPGTDRGSTLAVDGAGNITVAGDFQHTVDFDPGPGTTLLTSYSGTMDVFLLRLNSDGNTLYAKVIGGQGFEEPLSMALDASGNIILSGTFTLTSDLDPGPGTFSLTSAGSVDGFVARYTASGAFINAWRMGAGNADYAHGVAVNSAGDVFVTGAFSGTVDFDPGAAVTNLMANVTDIFLARYGTAGNLVFAVGMGGTSSDRGHDVVLDASGTPWITGSFSGTADLDPGVATNNLVSAGSSDVLLAHYDALGNYLLAKNMGGPSQDVGQAIARDASGNLWISGQFYGTADFDPGPGNTSFTSPNGNFDVFLAKYDATGSLLFAGAFGSADYENGPTLAVDVNGRVHLGGYCTGQMDVDPGAGTMLLSPLDRDAFFMTLSSTGVFVNAGSIGGHAAAGNCNIAEVAQDPAGNTYIAGWHGGAIDFDPGPGAVVLTSTVGYDPFVAKYGPTGALIYARSFAGDGTTNNQAFGIVADAAGNAYACGRFRAPLDMDPGPDISMITSAGFDDVFFVKLDAAGDLVFAHPIGGPSNDLGRCITLDGSGNIFISGEYSGTVDFDPGPGVTNLTSVGGSEDVFFAKYTPGGALVFAKGFGSTSGENGNSVAVTPTGEIWVAGTMSATTDFDPSASTYNLTSAGSIDAFLARYSSTGNFLFAGRMGSTSLDQVHDLDVDAMGRAYISGRFYGTVDFDPSAGTLNLTSGTGNGVFVACYSATGNVVYANSVGGTGTTSWGGIDVAPNGTASVTGLFSGQVDFDPGGGSTILTSAFDPEMDIFLARYGPTGSFLDVLSMGGAGDKTLPRVALSALGDPVVSASFVGTLDMDPSAGVIPLAGVNSAYAPGGLLVKYLPCSGDLDSDGALNCVDGCPSDATKTAPGTCGCGQPEPGAACNDGNAATSLDQIDANCVCTGTTFTVRVNVRAMLEGPFVSGSGIMNDALRAANLIPASEPYSALGYVYTGGGGGEVAVPGTFTATGNNAIVDWALVELRNAAAPSQVLASRAGLLQRDGDVVDVDGSSSLGFTLAPGSYKVAVRHRNHLGAMTLNNVNLTATPVLVDLSASTTAAYGTSARKTIGAKQVLWAGDATFNGELRYTGSGNDRDPILIAVGPSTPSNTVTNQYRREDLNLDAIVKYTGSGNDRDIILTNVGSTTPNNTRTQQLP